MKLKLHKLLLGSLLLAGAYMITQKLNADKTPVAAAVDTSHAVQVRYCNYRGEVGVRSIVPMEVYWGQTEYHPHDQWLLKVWDVEKNAERIYAFKDIQEFDVK